MRARYVTLLFLGLLGVGIAPARSELAAPEPYLLVRSMRMLQDQVASGKPEALPMLNRVLGHIADDLQRARPDVWQKPENVYALLVYLLNGGNPAIVRNVIGTLQPGQVDQKLIAGSLAYADGDSVRALDNFEQLPEGIPSELVASIYLVTADHMAAIDAGTALRRLDYIRLNAPGTLLEEAALRRELVIAARLGESDKVRGLARNYLQRFERSPYSEDFFRQFVEAILKLKGKMTDHEIDDIASLAWRGAQLPLYLRIARGSIVNGDLARARFAAEKARDLAVALKADGTQAQLYLSVANVGSDKTAEAGRILNGLSRKNLHERDLELLDAARAMAAKITAQPVAVAPPAEPAQPRVRESSAIAAEARPAEYKAPAEDSRIIEARKKLDAIDAILGSTRR